MSGGKNAKKILCGLDIGTNSVGWCITNEENNIIRWNGKPLIGVRLFEDAADCKARRLFRSNRRRMNRRKERINLLRQLFAKEINSADETFFERLDNSMYKIEDKNNEFVYTLFNDRNFTDKDYYDEFPTIYHLRHHLINSNKKEDIRLIYLALHHLIKYRGNFLLQGNDFKPLNKDDLKEYMNSLNLHIGEFNETLDEDDKIKNLIINDENFDSIKNIFVNERGISAKKEKLIQFFEAKNNHYLKNVILPFLAGSSLQIKQLKIENYSNDDIKNLCVNDEAFDINIETLIASYPEYEALFNILVVAKAIYNFFLLGKLLGNHKYLCDAMIEKYKEHNSDLKLLKEYVKANIPDEYSKIFRESIIENKTLNNYTAYIGSNITSNSKFNHKNNKATQKDFYKFLKETLKLEKYEITAENQNEPLSIIKQKIDDGCFLNKLNSTSNGVFPYQLNMLELEAILHNQSKYYDFLKVKDEDGLTIIDKIKSILSFKIPYYVGPLVLPKENYDRTKFSWVERKNEKIYPWNFDKVVDLDSSAERFINRMLNKCTYLPSCYCLAKNSIYFSYYNVLSNLNKISINGTALTIEQKDDIIKKVFCTNRKVTKKNVEDYVKSIYGCDAIITYSTTGKEVSVFNCNMMSYYDFCKIFGKEYVNNNIDTIENIIRDIVIFEDKAILEKRLENKYSFDKKTIKQIKALSYNGFASLSKELLTLVACDEDGEITEFDYGSIIEIMHKTNQSLQEVLFSERYNFQEKIKEYNLEKSSNDNLSIKEFVDDSFATPGMKRAIIQAYKIIDEIEDILKRPIDEYYIECTRTNREKKNVESKSRYQKTLELYKTAYDFMKEDKLFIELNEKLKNFDQNAFQSDKYYLYFSQFGRCMYSGEPINLEELYDNEKYDIDHIIPQSIIKDDSLSNRVLVKQELNREKSDTYPIPQNILFKGNYKAAYKYYKSLYDAKLISEEKYNRLTKRELSETELESFVNRQLVYTNQAVSGLIKAIKFFKTTDEFEPKIVYSKGENVTDFRKRYGLLKSRSVNNFHHAHDAYLNIIVGRTLDSYFGPYQSKKMTLKQMHADGLTTNVVKIFEQNKNNTKKPILDLNGNIVWNFEKSVKKVENVAYNQRNITITTRVYIGSELFGKTTVYPAGIGNIPVKNNCPLSDTSKYGGFKQYAFGSYAIIKSNNNYFLEAIPTIYSKKHEEEKYLKEVLNKYSDGEILFNNLGINTVFRMQKRKFCITGKSGNSFFIKNLNERYFGRKEINIIKKIEKLITECERKRITIKGDETLDNIKQYGFECDNSKLIIANAKNKDAQIIEISNEELLNIYNYFIQLTNKEIFAFTQTINLHNKLVDSIGKFNNLSILGKCKVIYNLLDHLKCNERKSVDLKLLGLSLNEAVMLINNKINEYILVFESITGLRTKEIIIKDL